MIYLVLACIAFLYCAMVLIILCKILLQCYENHDRINQMEWVINHWIKKVDVDGRYGHTNILKTLREMAERANQNKKPKNEAKL